MTDGTTPATSGHDHDAKHVESPLSHPVTKGTVGILGATSLVGGHLLTTLSTEDARVVAFTRSRAVSGQLGVTWRVLPVALEGPLVAEEIKRWVCLAPIWVLPDYFTLLEAVGAKRVVALSSTSRYTKMSSTVRAEKELARRLSEAEHTVQDWAAEKGIECIVLRPTMIYGGGADGNVTAIASVVRRLGFFPIVGKAHGLRQPVHAADVATACAAAVSIDRELRPSYDLSGGEVLTYRDMVRRVCRAMGRRPLTPSLPLPVFWLAVGAIRRVPKFRHWSPGMAVRMNKDMVFGHQDAKTDLGFCPRAFSLGPVDVGAR